MKILRIVVALTFALGTALFSPSVALAHDEVTGTSPASKSTVAAGAFDVSVSFNEEILNLKTGKGLVIQVFAPGMKYVSKDCVRVDGKTMSTRIDVDKPGTYVVAWQSVSSDGHQTTGVFNFKVTNDNNYKSSPTHVCDYTSVNQGSSAAPTSETTETTASPNMQVVIQTMIFTLAVLGGLGFFGWRFLKRRKANLEE